MVATLPLEGAETYMLLLFEWSGDIRIYFDLNLLLSLFFVALHQTRHLRPFSGSVNKNKNKNKNNYISSLWCIF
jgi:hypothetical protein